jgi:hypothetical protein
MKSVTLVSLLLGAWLMCATANAAVKATVDTNRLSTGETLELTLSHDGQTGSQPDLTPLEKDFDVLSTSRSSNVQIINGSMSSQTQLTLTLSPKRAGQLTIPSLTWNNERSAPIQITVSGNGSSPSAQDQAQSSNVFLVTSVDEPRPYVQGAVKLTVRLHAAVPIYRATLDLPASSNVLVQQLGKDRNSEKLINGRQYTVIERQYLLFPQQSGALEIPGPVLDAQIAVRSPRSSRDPFSDFFDRSPFGDMRTLKPIRIRGDDVKLQVRPRPAAATASYWIPAQDLTVASTWQPDSLQTQVGEPVTLDLRLRAEGLTAAQLPDVLSLLQLPQGLKAYPDQAKLENSEAKGTIVGERIQSVALIADRAGDFRLPAVSIQWWDTKADELRTIELPARTLRVLPAPGTTSRAAPSAAPQGAPAVELDESAPGPTASSPANVSNGPWQWVSLALVILWLGTVLAWWLSRRRAMKAPAEPPPQAPAPARVNASEARDRFLSACKVNDAIAARRALLEWARAKWPDAPPLGLRALADKIEDARTAALLVELDRACFAGGEWNGAALAQALSKLPARPEKTTAPRSELAELYP